MIGKENLIKLKISKEQLRKMFVSALLILLITVSVVYAAQVLYQGKAGEATVTVVQNPTVNVIKFNVDFGNLQTGQYANKTGSFTILTNVNDARAKFNVTLANATAIHDWKITLRKANTIYAILTPSNPQSDYIALTTGQNQFEAFIEVTAANVTQTTIAKITLNVIVDRP